MYKQRKKLVILFVLLGIVIILGIIYFVLDTFRVENVYVEGNIHYTEEEIKSIVMDGTFGDNSLYLTMKYKNKGVENIPFVDVMDVSILSPDSIRITVYEKALAGYVKYLDTYTYFDKDGYVVENSTILTRGIPQVTGLSFNHCILGEPLPVADEKVFNSILSITKLLNKYELVADKIYFKTADDFTIYFKDVRVILGNDNNTLEDKVMLLPEFLPVLENKKGVLNMTEYNEDNGRYTFEPDSE